MIAWWWLIPTFITGVLLFPFILMTNPVGMWLLGIMAIALQLRDKDIYPEPEDDDENKPEEN